MMRSYLRVRLHIYLSVCAALSVGEELKLGIRYLARFNLRVEGIVLDVRGLDSKYDLNFILRPVYLDGISILLPVGSERNERKVLWMLA